MAATTTMTPDDRREFEEQKGRDAGEPDVFMPWSDDDLVSEPARARRVSPEPPIMKPE